MVRAATMMSCERPLMQEQHLCASFGGWDARSSLCLVSSLPQEHYQGLFRRSSNAVYSRLPSSILMTLGNQPKRLKLITAEAVADSSNLTRGEGLEFRTSFCSCGWLDLE